MDGVDAEADVDRRHLTKGTGVPGVEQPSEPERTVDVSRMLIAGACLAIIAVALRAANDIVAPLMLALALTIVFHPLRAMLSRHMPSWLASVFLLLGAYLLLLVLGLALLVSIARLADLLPEYQSQLESQFSALGDTLNSWGVTDSQIAAMGDKLSTSALADAVGSLFSEILGVLSNFFFIVTLLLFLAFDAAQTRPLMEHARRFRPHLVDAMASFAHGTRSYLSVSAVFGLIVAVIDTVALTLMGVPGAFVWGVLAFVTNFIPNIGFVIGLVPPALIGLLEGGPGLMFAVIAMYCVVNFVIQSIIQPRIVGNAVGLSTTLTFLSLVFWTWILGPLGALLAVPTSLFFRAVLIEADPRKSWLLPVVSGRLDDPALETADDEEAATP